jgi:hypothetical protein
MCNGIHLLDPRSNPSALLPQQKDDMSKGDVMHYPASPLRESLKPARWIANSNSYLGSRLVTSSRRQGRFAGLVVLATHVV